LLVCFCSLAFASFPLSWRTSIDSRSDRRSTAPLFPPPSTHLLHPRCYGLPHPGSTQGTPLSSTSHAPRFPSRGRCFMPRTPSASRQRSDRAPASLVEAGEGIEEGILRNIDLRVESPRGALVSVVSVPFYLDGAGAKVRRYARSSVDEVNSTPSPRSE